MEHTFTPPVAAEFSPNSALTIGNGASAAPVPASETYSSVMQAQVEASVKARYSMALARPRDFFAVRERILNDARRPSFAACAIYHKPIGKGVEGPSIRFVEAALRAMGNVFTETVVTYDDAEKRIVRVSVTDLETNTYYNQDVTIQKTVERSSVKEGEKYISKRINSYGKPVYTVAATDDDILNKTNALISKAVRTLGLRIVPGDITDEAIYTARLTMANADAKDPNEAKRKLVDAFAGRGIKVDELTEYLGHSLDASISPAELSELRNIYSAIRDGETTWKAVMDNRREQIVEESKAKASSKSTAARKEEPSADQDKATEGK